MTDAQACDLSNPVSVYSCLQTHLHAICAVEFYTIPVYLTAAYSFSVAAQNSQHQFTPKDSCGTGVSKQNFIWWMQQQAISVAVQEMYHLQCAANLADAFGTKPDLVSVFSGYSWSGPVPHLKKVSLPNGLGNLQEVIETLEEIEQSAGGVMPPPNSKAEYDSITELYHATLTLMENLLQKLIEGSILEPGPVLPDGSRLTAANQIAYQTFVNRYQFNTIGLQSFFSDICHLMNAVSFQGEGADVTNDYWKKFPTLSKVLTTTPTQSTPGKIPKQYQPKPGSRFSRWDCDSHYNRFTGLKQMMDSQDFIAVQQEIGLDAQVFNTVGVQDPGRPSWVVAAEIIQDTTNKAYSYLLDIIVDAMQNGGGGLDNSSQQISFTQAMTAFKYLLPQLWQWGQVSTFSYETGVTEADLQSAMDKADPLCLYHWDEATRQLRQDHPTELNVCQGLNSCKGRGWGAMATQAGDGACATLDIHTCVQGNACKNQGACGFVTAGQPCENVWVPGQNSCKGQGGCQVPIATEQKFSGNTPDGCDKQKLVQTSVWDEARKLLAAGLGKKELPEPKTYQGKDISYNGTDRREAITPTST